MDRVVEPLLKTDQSSPVKVVERCLYLLFAFAPLVLIALMLLSLRLTVFRVAGQIPH